MKHIGYETASEYERARQKSFATMRANLLDLVREAEQMLLSEAVGNEDQRNADLALRVGQCTSTLYLLANLDPPSAVEPYRRLATLMGEPLAMPLPFVDFLQRFDQRGATDGNIVDLAAWRDQRRLR